MMITTIPTKRVGESGDVADEVFDDGGVLIVMETVAVCDRVPYVPVTVIV
jgi:hypothetical protein